MVISFAFAGRVIDYFGSKAITSNNTAIIELIKNSRDANATEVDIRFAGAGNKNGTIAIEDNGDGMNMDDIQNKWMVIGTDSRIVDNKTKRGKAVWGEMGIGRMACHKLGNDLRITTVKKNQKTSLQMDFDWAKFEKPGVRAEDVKFDDPIRYTVKNPEHGVTLEIFGLKSKWSPADINRLKEEVAIMLSEDTDSNFTVRINDEDASKSYAKMKKKVLDHAPFKLKAKFDGNNLSVKIFNFWGSKKWEEQDVRGYYDDSKIGPFEMEVWHFPRAQGKIKDDFKESYYESNIGTEMLDHFLKKNFNVMLYRDDIWFKPYGLGYDWLGIDTAKGQANRKLGIKEFYGAIRLSKKKNPEIKQASHRETIIRNAAFEELEHMVKNEILETLRKARDEWKKAEKKKDVISQGGDPDDPLENREKIIRNLMSLATQLPQTDRRFAKTLINGLKKNTEEQVTEAESNVEAMGELRDWENNIAMIGIAASYMSREVAKSLSANMEITQEATEMHAHLTKTNKLTPELMERGWEMIETLGDNQQRMKHFMKFLNVMGKHVADAKKRKNRPTQISVLECWETVLNGFESKRKDLDVEIYDSGFDNLKVNMSRIDLECILTQLYLNSIESLKHVKNKKKKIDVTVDHKDNNLFLNFKDNGTGVGKTMTEKIFEPFELGHNADDEEYHGHGLGLYFVKRIIDQHYGGGSVGAVNRNPGLEIQITFADVPRVSR